MPLKWRAVRGVLRSVLGICSVYYATEIFGIYVDFESQTTVLIDVWNFGKFINYKFVLIESEGEIWYFT